MADLQYDYKVKPKTKSIIEFSKMTRYSSEQKGNITMEYEPKYDYVFRKTAFAGVAFRKLLKR